MTSANPVFDTIEDAIQNSTKYPALAALRDAFGSPWDAGTGNSLSRFGRFLDDPRMRFLSFPETYSVLGHPKRWLLPSPREALARPPLCLDLTIPILDSFGTGPEHFRFGQRRPLRGLVLYEWTHDLWRRPIIAAKFVAIVPLGGDPFPVVMPGTVLIDPDVYDDSTSLGFGDFLRAQNGVRLAREAPLPDLMQMDSHVARIGRFILRCPPKPDLTVDIRSCSYNYDAVVEYGTDGLEAFLAATVVDVGDVLNTKTDEETQKIQQRLSAYVISRGAFLALSGLRVVAHQPVIH